MPAARELDQHHQAIAREIKALPWMQDGIDEAEAKAIDEIRWLARASSAAALSLVGFGWVRDDIDQQEAAAIDTLVGTNHGPAAASAVAKPWIADGISPTEKDALQTLWWLGDEDAERFLGMPFLGSLETSDAVALSVLLWLSRNEDMYRKVTTTQPFADGLTDEWAIVVTTLSSVIHSDDLLGKVFDPASVTVETSTVSLPLAGDVAISFVRIDVDGSDESIEIAKDVLVEVESVMGLPLPTTYVGVLVADGGWWAHNAWTHVAMRPLEDEDPDTTSKGSYGLRHLLTHEFAHYYWHSNATWIDEGIANALADLHELRVAGRNTFAERRFACQESAIQDIDEDAPGSCFYDLGTQLFIELNGALGDGPFREGLRALYLMEGRSGIEALRKAFESGGTEALSIINRWYGTA